MTAECAKPQSFFRSVRLILNLLSKQLGRYSRTFPECENDLAGIADDSDLNCGCPKPFS